MLDFVIVYDANTTPVVEVADFIILLVAAALCAVYWVQRGVPGGGIRGPFGNPVVIAGVCVFSVLVTASLTWISYSEVTWLRQRLRDGAYEQVEGRVENFVAGTQNEDREERWTVRSGGRTYTYTYKWSRRIPGFHQSAGPVREGLRVRIADVDGYIARLEIEK